MPKTRKNFLQFIFTDDHADVVRQELQGAVKEVRRVHLRAYIIAGIPALIGLYLSYEVMTTGHPPFR